MGIFGPKKQSTKPDFSNVEHGSSTTAPAAAPAVFPDLNRASFHTYVVVAGDSLSKIAKRQYGNASRWPEIHEANREAIKDPNLIYPGQELRIPAAHKA